MVEIPGDNPDNPLRLPSSLLLQERFPQLLAHIFNYANRPETADTEATLLTVLNLPNQVDRDAVAAVYRRIREYIASGRNNVWQWYIANLIQPLRLANLPVSRMVGNPPWVVYNAMSDERQNAFREHAAERGLWAGRYLATQNDLAATFVATCTDFYLSTGGKFGFVLPYAALRTGQWAPFRTGEWSLRQDAEEGTHVDLSKDAWDFSGVNAPPFPQAQSSVLFGTKVPANRQSPNLKPLAEVQQKTGSGIDTKMPWNAVKPLLSFSYRKEYPIAQSQAYAKEFRVGATLFPQSLVVFERPAERSRGVVYFKTNPAKGAWRNTERQGNVEDRFVKPALFSRLLLPFGATGHSHIIAPFDADSKSVMESLPHGNDVQRFNLYWSEANADYVQIKSPKSPETLAKRIDLFGNLSAQLKIDLPKIVYSTSGSILTAAIVSSDVVISHSLYWTAPQDLAAAHYLAAIFNARCLEDFFKDACRASDRSFMLLPVQNLPIPAYDGGDARHADLAAQSQAAHRRVADLVSERQAAGRRINRNDVLRDGALQPILGRIDEGVRAILPAYCA